MVDDEKYFILIESFGKKMKIECVSKLENIESIHDRNDADVGIKIILKNGDNVNKFKEKFLILFIIG